MAESKVYRRGGGGRVEFNMTPMIDVTFQLIIFFILAGQVASAELVQMKVPRPTESQALPENAIVKNRVIINIVSKAGVEKEDADPFLAGQAKEYRAAGKAFEAGDKEGLQELLEMYYNRWMQDHPGSEFFVEIRADHRVRYGHVEPALLAAAAAGIPKMNITALVNLN